MGKRHPGRTERSLRRTHDGHREQEGGDAGERPPRDPHRSGSRAAAAWEPGLVTVDLTTIILAHHKRFGGSYTNGIAVRARTEVIRPLLDHHCAVGAGS